MTSVPRELVEPYQNYHRAADLVYEMRMVVYAAEANLLDANDALDLAEAHLVLEAQGKNAEERKANLTLLMAEDGYYAAARRVVAQRRQELAQAQANLEREIDRKRGWGWIVRSVAGVNAPSSDEA